MNTDDLGMVVRTDPIMALNTCAALSDSCGAGGFTVAYGLSELGTQSLDAAAEGVGELVHADVDRVARRTRRSRGSPDVIR